MMMLGLVGSAPSHGYDLKRSYDRLFSSGRPVAFGQVYAALSRLLRDDLVLISGEEAGRGPERKRYEITSLGRDRVRRWMLTPESPVPGKQGSVYAKTLIGLLLDDDPARVLEVQRQQHVRLRRELTNRKRDADLPTSLLCDHALLHIEADLHFMDLTASRLGELKETVRS
nr:PadR family transcriptional regulator [Clavibacter sp. VKM Ac-2873]